MEVWVIEAGEYGERSVWAVASSVEAACRYIQKQYGDPYNVTWDPVVFDDEDSATLTGRFTRVEGYCDDGLREFSFTRYAIEIDTL